MASTSDVRVVCSLDPWTNQLVELSTRSPFHIIALVDLTTLDGDLGRDIHIGSSCEHDHHILAT